VQTRVATYTGQITSVTQMVQLKAIGNWSAEKFVAYSVRPVMLTGFAIAVDRDVPLPNPTIGDRIDFDTGEEMCEGGHLGLQYGLPGRYWRPLVQRKKL